MCKLIHTRALHQEFVEHFEESEPNRHVSASYVEQFEPWRTVDGETWTDEDLELLLVRPPRKPSQLRTTRNRFRKHF